MSDLIDRQAAIDAHYEYCNKHPDAGFPVWSLKILEDLPSAQPDTDRIYAELSKAYNVKGLPDEAIGIIGDLMLSLDTPSTQPEQRWIPTSERLPEDEQPIIFSTKTGRVHQGKYHKDDSVNQWYSNLDKMRAWNNVVNAWMPLPEPYTERREE